MRVLVLITRLPLPPWRGDQIRALHHLRCLAPRHDITCCALLPREPSAALRAAVAALGVRLVVEPLGWLGAVPALARVLAGDRRPLQVLFYERRRARRRVAARIAAGGFDVVHAQLVRTAAYLPSSTRPPVVIDLIDALSLNMARRAALEGGPLAPVAACEAARLRCFEPALAAQVARCLVVSAADRAAIGAGRIDVVPNGVDTAAFAFAAAPRRTPRLVFSGNLGYFPNVDAARWMVRDVFPRIRAQVPAAELRLVGARPARAVRALAAVPGVTVVRDVPAMAPELAAAAVAVVPMRSGTGLQNKVLEAMAVGTPVVTTPAVAAALEVVPGEHLLVAGDADGLAAAAVALLTDPGRGRALAVAARTLVERRYRWEASAAAVEAAWEAAVAAARDGVGAPDRDAPCCARNGVW